MKIAYTTLAIVISIMIIPSFNHPAFASLTTRINPTTDLIYLGAFNVPEHALWSYGGLGMTYYPDGDPQSSDGYPGSLYVLGRKKDFNASCAEISIPVPVVGARNPSTLNFSTFLQGFNDITGGEINGSLTGFRIGDVHYLSPRNDMSSGKLFWVKYEYYTPDPEYQDYGWSNLDISNPNPKKLWGLVKEDGTNVSASFDKYIFDIPESWATQHTGGRTIAVGRARTQGGGSYGPALLATEPSKNGDPPSDGTNFSTKILMHYPGRINRWKRWGMGADKENDGAWLTLGNKSAVIIVGRKGMRNAGENGTLYYGPPSNGCDGSKGYHSYPNMPSMLFYDPDDFADVLDGKKETYEIEPYAIFNSALLTQKGFTCEGSEFGGVGYDRKNNLLYVVEQEAFNGSNDNIKAPLIHVWKLADAQSNFDNQPPTAPSNFEITEANSTAISMKWDASTDNSGKVVYVIWRNPIEPPKYASVEATHAPIAMTEDTSYRDTHFPALDGQEFTYYIEARDTVNNKSSKSNAFKVYPYSGNFVPVQLDQELPAAPTNVRIINTN